MYMRLSGKRINSNTVTDSVSIKCLKLVWFLHALADHVHQCVVVRPHSPIRVHVSSVMPSRLVLRLEPVRPLSLAHFLFKLYQFCDC